MNEQFVRQTQLVGEVLGVLNQFPQFALKGGTAINLFFQNLPRLSVDIDLVYVPITPREEALADITVSLNNLSQLLETKGYSTIAKNKNEQSRVSTLYVQSRNTMVKVEVNTIFRGAVLPTVVKRICSRFEDEFGISTNMQLLAFDEVYAGKFCAALDRQHPRDLYDVHNFFQISEISTTTFEVFLIYLLGHNRPPHELLNPQIKQINNSLLRGMTAEPISEEQLMNSIIMLKKSLLNSFTSSHKEFILKFFNGATPPKSQLFENYSLLPAIQWKLLNLKNMDDGKRRLQVKLLEEVLK